MGKVVDGEGPSPVLRPACEAIRTLLASGTRDDARMRHRIGEIIVGIKKARDKYGARAVEEIARAVGTNVHTLYRCAAVAECWSEAQIAALLLRTNAHGQPLSWSQLVLIAGMTSPRRRAELIEQTLRDALTVRQLLVLVETAGKSGGETAPWSFCSVSCARRSAGRRLRRRCTRSSWRSSRVRRARRGSRRTSSSARLRRRRACRRSYTSSCNACEQSGGGSSLAERRRPTGAARDFCSPA